MIDIEFPSAPPIPPDDRWGQMGGLSHEDYYPRLCDRSLRRRDDRLGTLGSLLSDQGKGL